MDALIVALLSPQGLESVEDLEKDLFSIRSKLDDARRSNHNQLIPQLQKKLEKREKLQREIQYSVTELLDPWGFDSVDSLRNAMMETVSDRERALNKGYSELVEEETEKLLGMQELLRNVLEASSKHRRAHSVSRSVPSQDTTVGTEELTSPPMAFPVETKLASKISETPPPRASTPADAQEIPDSRLPTFPIVGKGNSNDLLSSILTEMPDCAEKSLTLLYTYFKSESVRFGSDDLQREGEPPTVPEALLRDHYKRLLHHISNEELASPEVDGEINEFAKMFNKYVTHTNLLSGELSDLVENMEYSLFRALRSIAPLDVGYLLKSVRGSTDAAHLIKDSDVILLLGSTGAGKSTLMHFLAGSKMRITEVSGIQHLEPEVVMSGLEDVTFSCSSRSETSGIHAISMHFNDKTYIVCDTAGLGDTRGPEQDITSGIVMTRAIRSAKSVKLVLLITQGAISDRYSNLRKTLVPSITRLVPAFGNHVSSIFYLFNMIIDKLEGVAARLKNFSTHLEPAEKADISFTAMITDLARKAQLRTHCSIADMIDGSNVELLERLDSLEAIQNPSEVFHDFAAPISISILKDQLRLHKAAVLKGLARFVLTGERENLPLVNFKLLQLRDLHETIGLPECSSIYFDCVRELSTTIQNVHDEVYHRIELCFQDEATVAFDTELGECIDMVWHLYELDDIRVLHPQLNDPNEKEEVLTGSDVKEIIAALFKRMMKESGKNITAYVSIVQRSDLSKIVEQDPDFLPLGHLISSRLDKMRSLAQIATLVNNRAVVELAGVFARVEQLFKEQVSALNGVTTDVISNLQTNIELKAYLNCLLPFQQLKALSLLKVSPDLLAHETLLRLQSLFLDSIISDCEDARRLVDENASGCEEVFCVTVQRILEVTSLPAFKGIVDLERLNLAMNSLTAQVAASCERVEAEFQLSFSSHDADLFSKLKIRAAVIDKLRTEAVVSRVTFESHHSLITSVKDVLEWCSRQAFMLIGAIAKGDGQTQDTAAHPLDLKTLLLSIHDASTFEGGLHNVYKRELKDLIEAMSAIIATLTDHVVNGEDGVKVSYRRHDRLKSLYCKRFSVFQLGEIVDADCRKKVPELRSLSNMITDSIDACDKSIAAVASQGIVVLRSLLAASASQISSVSFKHNVRDALLFFATAESLGFKSFLSCSQEADIASVNAYFISVADHITLLVKRADLKHRRSFDQIDTDDSDEFDEDNAHEIKKCFIFLRSFEGLLSQNSGRCVDGVKGSIHDAIERPTVAVSSLLTDLNNYAEELGAATSCGPSVLAALFVDFQLCNLLSAVDEFLPTTADNLKFIATAYKFKSAISKISSSTRHKIPTNDFDGVLNDLEKFDTENVLVAAELRSILQEVFTALTSLLGKSRKTAENFQLGTTSHEATVALFNDLREISEKSMLFVRYLADDQVGELAKRKAINEGINRMMHLICTECKSRLEDLNVTPGKSNFYDAEKMLSAAARTLPMLGSLASNIKTANAAHSDHSPQSNPKKGERLQSITTFIELTEEIADMLQSKTNALDTVVSGISSHYCKPINIVQVRSMAPNKLFDDLKRAEQFHPRYNAAATCLHEYLLDDVMSSLVSIQRHVEGNNSLMEMDVVSEKHNQKQVWMVTTTMGHSPLVENTTQTTVNGSGGVFSPNLAETLQSSQTLIPGLTDSAITSLEHCEDLVRNIELFTPFFPLELFERYQSKLEMTKVMIENTKRAHEVRINEATNGGITECDKILDLFNRYVSACDFKRMKDAGDRLNNQREVLIRKITFDLEAGSLSSVLIASMPLHRRWLGYVDQLENWKNNPIYYWHYWRSFYFRSYVKSDINSPIMLMRDLLQSFLRAINVTISGLNKARIPQLEQLEPLFDGLCAFLGKDGDIIRSRILLLDQSICRRASGAILSIGRLFSATQLKISTLIAQLENVMSFTVVPSVADANLLGDDLATASKLIVLARESIPLFLKLKGLCQTPSILSDQHHNMLCRMKLLSYEELNVRVNATIELIQKVARPSLLDNELLITPNASDRNFFYHRVQIAMTLLVRRDKDQAIAKGCVNSRANEESSRDKISSEIENIGSAADRLVNTTEYERFGMLYDNLRSISENLSDSVLKDRAVGRMKSVDGLVFQRIEDMKIKGWLNESEWNSQPFEDVLYEKVAKQLINMKTATTHVALYKERIDKDYIDKLLNDYSTRPTGAGGASFFLGLSIYLGGIRTSDAPIASQILSDHAAFSGHKLLLRNERILRFTVQDMMHDITGDDETTSGQQLSQATKDHLLQISVEFEEEYWALVEIGLEGNKLVSIELESIIKKTKEIARNKDLPQRIKIRSLMAHIFAYWTLNESTHYEKSKAQNVKSKHKTSVVKKNKALLQPHSGQIVGILRLFGLDEGGNINDLSSDGGALKSDSKKSGTGDSEEEGSSDNESLEEELTETIDPEVQRGSDNDMKFKLKSHLLEIGTGEGKSVTLAVSAMLLALLGFEVDVVCYSEYLTNRDHQSFEHLFDSFGLSEFINYGTFELMCGKFINRRGDMRSGVRSVISGADDLTEYFDGHSDAAPCILLVDEVDVFFDKTIYYSTYNPAYTLRGSEITAFIKELWAVHKQGSKAALTKDNIIQWPAFVACRERFKGWEYILDGHLDSLIYGLNHFDGPHHKYHVDSARSRIGYKQFDGIGYNTYHGALTMFAYFNEHENGKVTTTALEKELGLNVRCGNFSYAAIPKMYDSILGVSGTLKELGDYQRKVLRDEYNVKNATYIRSVYGSNKLIFDANAASAIKITNIVEYYKEIVNEIHLQLKGKIKNRAVLVFLKTKKEVDDFLASSPMNGLKGQVRVIREEDTAADRELTVRQSVTSKSVTVMSCDFGRGTDFVCFDDELDASGGVHVIQTFVSMDVSEERQIKGRTARQGNQGSYSMVLLDSELKAFGISMDMIRDLKDRGKRYTEIDQKRRKICNASYEMNSTSLGGKHEVSLALLQAMYRNDIPAVKEILRTLNSSVY